MCDTRCDPNKCLHCVASPTQHTHTRVSKLAWRPTAWQRPAGLCRQAGHIPARPYKVKEVNEASDTSAAMNAAQLLVDLTYIYIPRP